jgi:hypothetical protein
LKELSEANIGIPWKGSLLDTIRERPAMYIGQKSLTALWFYLHGYEDGRITGGYKGPSELPRRFADWVGYRLQLGHNFSGFWARAILSRVRDESLAVDRFYELRDEYLRRKEQTVAIIRGDRRQYKTTQLRVPEGDWVERIEMLPKSLRIVVYTQDPGFFLEADENESFFFNGRLEEALGEGDSSDPERFKVVDQTTWSRLLAESKRYKQNLSRRRARIQKGKREALLKAEPRS